MAAMILGSVLGIHAGAVEPLDPVAVHFDLQCKTRVIELEVYDRRDGRWEPHIFHPRILSGSCQIEDAGYLMNEIRLRCLEPLGSATPSWITGVEVYRPGVIDACTPASQRAPVVTFTSHESGARVQSDSRWVRVEGRIDFPETPIEGARDDLVATLLEDERRALPSVRTIHIGNALEPEFRIEVSPDEKGRFRAVVPLRAGENRLRAKAVASNERWGSAELLLDFDISRIRARWMDLERRRIEAERARLRGYIEIGAEDRPDPSGKGRSDERVH